MEVVFVQWPFLYVVAGNCFFFSGSDNAVVSKKSYSMTDLYLMLLPLACCFLYKKFKKSLLLTPLYFLCYWLQAVFVPKK